MAKTLVCNAKPLCDKTLSGVHRKAIELFKELDTMDIASCTELAIPAGGTLAFTPKHIRVVELKRPFPHCPWASVVFPRYVKKIDGVGLDLLMGLSPWGCDVQEICDTIAELFPQDVATLPGRLSRRNHIARVDKAVRTSKVILTGTECSKSDIVRLHGCDPDKIHVIPCAWQHISQVEPDTSILEKLDVEPGSFFFSLGHRTYHKNFRWIIEAARQNPTHTFVATGLRSVENTDEYDDSQNPANLLYTGYLSDGEIVALMQACKAFVHPALYEGFGIPPLEAMALGARCLVSTGGSLPEVYGDAVTYFDPLDYAHISMDELMAHTPKGSTEACLARYSWHKSASLLADVLRELL